ncbi:MAG: hypothetical protein ACPHL6_13265, partial [Rubripirellula sp.]
MSKNHVLKLNAKRSASQKLFSRGRPETDFLVSDCSIAANQLVIHVTLRVAMGKLAKQGATTGL